MFSKVGHCFVIAINIGIEFGQPERKGGSLGHINCSDVTTATVNRGISIPKLIFVCLNCCNLLAFVGFATIQASKEFCSNLRPRFEYVAFLSPTYSFLICDDHGLRTCGCWSERSVFGWNCPSAWKFSTHLSLSSGRPQRWLNDFWRGAVSGKGVENMWLFCFSNHNTVRIFNQCACFLWHTRHVCMWIHAFFLLRT